MYYVCQFPVVAVCLAQVVITSHAVCLLICPTRGLASKCFFTVALNPFPCLVSILPCPTLRVKYYLLCVNSRSPWRSFRLHWGWLLVAAQLAPEKSRISKVCEAQSILPLLSFCCSCFFPTWTICEDTSVRVHHSLITWVHSSSASLSNNIVLIALLSLGKVRFPALHCCQLSKWQVSHFPSVPVCHTSLEGKVGGPMGSGGQWQNWCASCVICWAVLGMLLSNSVLWCWTFRECSCPSSVLLTHTWNAVKNRKLFHKRHTSLLWEVA